MESVLFSHLDISVTRRVVSENSSDLDMGRRPKLKSDEFSDFSKQVGEIFSHLCLKPPKQVVQSLAAQPAVELEKSFQEWCDTWGPFRSRRVTDRVEDLRPRAVRERFSLTGTTPRRRPGTGYLLNYLINYLVNRFQVDSPYLRFPIQLCSFTS